MHMATLPSPAAMPPLTWPAGNRHDDGGDGLWEHRMTGCVFILRAQSMLFDPDQAGLYPPVHLPFIPPPHRCPVHEISRHRPYVATKTRMLAVNASITLKALVKGEPGTGKTMLAEEVAQALACRRCSGTSRATTKAQQGLYEYDAVSRLRDSQLGDDRVKDIHNYIVKGVLWQAFTAEQPVALLIDEIDKADIEFPNDLLRELDRMEFHCLRDARAIRASTARWCSSPRTTRRNCPTPSCAAASSTTSSSPTPTRCARSSTCTSRTSRKSC